MFALILFLSSPLYSDQWFMALLCFCVIDLQMPGSLAQSSAPPGIIWKVIYESRNKEWEDSWKTCRQWANENISKGRSTWRGAQRKIRLLQRVVQKVLKSYLDSTYRLQCSRKYTKRQAGTYCPFSKYISNVQRLLFCSYLTACFKNSNSTCDKALGII